MLFTIILQIIIIQFGSVAFSVAEGGLPLKFWGISVLIGSISLIVQQIINVLYSLTQKFNIDRNLKRKKKAGMQTTEQSN